MSRPADVVAQFDSARMLFGANPATDDEVSFALDGRRLDTPDRLIAFLAEIEASRSDPSSGVPAVG